MAYMSQEKKKQIAEELKKVLKGVDIKYSLSVHNHSTIVMKIKSGSVDFIGNSNEALIADHVELRNPNWKPAEGHIDVNVYWYREHFTGEVKAILEKIITAMNIGNHDNSDVQSDYFDVGWYVDVNVGAWDKPYELVK